MRFRMHRGLGCLAVHAGAALLIGVFCLGLDVYREWTATEMLERVGGVCLMEPCWGRAAIIEAKFYGASPTAEDLAALVSLRALQVVDLSFSRIGDCELAALVPCRAQLIIVPDGCTSRRVRQQFAEGRLVIGYGPSHPGVPTVKHYAKPYLEGKAKTSRAKPSPGMASQGGRRSSLPITTPLKRLALRIIVPQHIASQTEQDTQIDSFCQNQPSLECVRLSKIAGAETGKSRRIGDFDGSAATTRVPPQHQQGQTAPSGAF